MTTKEKLLELFESNKGCYFSGEDLAHKLCVSRAAVWKAVKALRNEGYSIDAVTNKGYSLSLKTDILSPQGIQKYLDSQYRNMDINVIASANSTNDLMREKINSGLSEGYTLIANEQTAGRGRRGKSFFSPNGSGIYMSILLKPCNYSARKAVRITTMAAVAMCEAIEEVSDKKPQIKWVNDIFVDNKKVCGILTEASLDIESSTLEYAVLGVGLNVYEPQESFPKELENIAGSLFKTTQDDMKNRIAASFINHFMYYYTAQNISEYTDKYRNYSLVIGKTVTVVSQNSRIDAKVIGIDDECKLQVEYASGETESLSYGEIDIKL